jgi:hypothetical protein
LFLVSYWIQYSFILQNVKIENMIDLNKIDGVF